LLLLTWGPWTDIGEQRRDSGPVFGEERHRRWGLGWGKWRGVRAAPVDGLGGGWGGLWRAVLGRRRPPQATPAPTKALCRCGSNSSPFPPT